MLKGWHVAMSAALITLSMAACTSAGGGNAGSGGASGQAGVEGQAGSRGGGIGAGGNGAGGSMTAGGSGGAGIAGNSGGGGTVAGASGAAGIGGAAGGVAGQTGSGGAGGTAGGQAATAGQSGSGGGSGGQGGAGNAGGGSRQIINMNQSWKFLLGDYSSAQMPSYNDTSWNSVGLPHSFSLPYFMWTQFYEGYGWYRKHFTVPAAWSGKRVFIEFQAAFQDAQVFVNGTQVGEHVGGYTGFSFDITSNVVSGDNVIAVRLNNKWSARVAPRAGDHTFSGGIYRDVFLVVTDPLHVTWYGTFVTTPTLAANAGALSTVAIKTEIRNDRAASAGCRVRTDIVDANGTTVVTVSSTQTIAPGTTVTIDQTTPAITKPALWHPDHPTMYKAVTTVSDGSGGVDGFTTPFGFRYFTWSASNGFSLNGSHYYLHGANVHQDHAGWGDGVADSALYRDVKMVKDAGLNFIRGSHYPKAPAFSDACDQLGVLFWSENPFWGSAASGEGDFNTAGAYPANAADQPPFDTNVLNTLTDMIRVHRNHPSIVAWSMSNEPFFTAGSTITSMRNLLIKEVSLSHQLDPTRPAGIGGAQRPTDSTRIDMLGDVAGYNGDGATLSVFQNPGIPSVINEYGSVTAVRPGNYTPGWGDLGSQLTGGFPTEFAWRSGQAVWCMFDHGSVKGTSLEQMGIVDYFRIPKRAWYWYRNAYANIAPPTWPSAGTPAGLQLTASTTTLSAVDGTQDALLNVTVVDASGKAINNNVPVTLTVTSGPGEFPTGPTITFTPPSTSNPQSDIAILDGQAAIEFRTYYAGTSVITASSPGLRSATVTITSQGSPAFVAGTTPAAPTRTYSRYAGGSATTTTDLTLALNHPTSASSSGGTTTPALANDGNAGTAWQAAGTDTTAWWQLFLEVARTVNTLQVTFPAAGNYRYTIAVSSDGKTWTTAVDQSQTTSTAQTQRATGSFGSNISYVRVSFVGVPAGQPAGLAEVVVGGM
jgi:beta-galactosidase